MIWEVIYIGITIIGIIITCNNIYVDSKAKLFINIEGSAAVAINN